MKLHTELVGHGPNRVLVLHDWTSTHRTYDACQAFFDLERFTYALVELRGYGKTHARSGDFSSAEVSQDLRDTAEALGWDRYHLIGHSMTGLPSLRATKEHGAAIQSLVLVTPIPATGLPADDDGRRKFEAAADDDETFVSIARMLSSSRLPETWYRAKLAQQRAEISREAFLGYLKMWTTENISAALGTLNTPTLVLVGAHDFEFFSLKNLQALLSANVPQARYELLNDAGHFPMSETPLRFVRLIEDFFLEGSRHAA
jgi:pimeloyl-ACP methyl ester carboxylesterase